MRRVRVFALVAVLALVASACSDEGGSEEASDLTVGMILVGPQDDRGWSQAHREGLDYVVEELGVTPIVVDKINPADSPDTSVEQVVDDMVDQGADIIFMTSDDMKDGALASAAAHPDVPMIWSSGDSAWEDGKGFAGLDNLGNVMGQMEYGKMIAGCAAALKTETGSLGYVGPLINDETRRLVNSAYLGATYCYENYRGEDPASLAFAVNWIGFWFNIPGVTLDPTQVTNDFLDGGSDVIISGIDTTEAIVRTGQRAEAGETLWAVPYDYEGACDEAPEICLGTPYFNWGPSYLDIVESVADGSFEATWEWLAPNWDDLTDNSTTHIGWVNGDGLGDAEADLEAFIAELADGLDLFDGTSDFDIWYTEELLPGIDGASS